MTLRVFRFTGGGHLQICDALCAGLLPSFASMIPPLHCRLFDFLSHVGGLLFQRSISWEQALIAGLGSVSCESLFFLTCEDHMEHRRPICRC